MPVIIAKFMSVLPADSDDRRPRGTATTDPAPRAHGTSRKAGPWAPSNDLDIERHGSTLRSGPRPGNGRWRVLAARFKMGSMFIDGVPEENAKGALGDYYEQQRAAW